MFVKISQALQSRFFSGYMHLGVSVFFIKAVSDSRFFCKAKIVSKSRFVCLFVFINDVWMSYESECLALAF